MINFETTFLFMLERYDGSNPKCLYFRAHEGSSSPMTSGSLSKLACAHLGRREMGAVGWGLPKTLKGSLDVNRGTPVEDMAFIIWLQFLFLTETRVYER